MGKQLAGLVNLRHLVNGGHELADRRVLVCVKSVGGRKNSKELILYAGFPKPLLNQFA